MPGQDDLADRMKPLAMHKLQPHEGCALQVNMEMGMLDKRRGDAIIEAATEVRASSMTTPTRRLYACASTLHS